MDHQRHRLLILSLVIALCVGGCARRVPVTGVTSIMAAHPAQLQAYLLAQKPDLSAFRLRGPFTIVERRDLVIELPGAPVVTVDLFLSGAGDKAPLVIIVHGQDNTKEDHEFQAMHVASWGMHGMTVQLPNHGPWVDNGRTLAALVTAIRSAPQRVDGHVDAGRIVLVGHSFGGTAISAAIGEGAQVLGGVLLDPAAIGRQLPALLRQIKVPMLVIGADEEIWPTRNRGYFFRFIPGAIGEVSIRGALHEDAQYPSADNKSRPFESGPLETEHAQITFVSALTAAAFSLSATGGIDYAWSSFAEPLRSGAFFNARKK